MGVGMEVPMFQQLSERAFDANVHKVNDVQASSVHFGLADTLLHHIVALGNMLHQRAETHRELGQNHNNGGQTACDRSRQESVPYMRQTATGLGDSCNNQSVTKHMSSPEGQGWLKKTQANWNASDAGHTSRYGFGSRSGRDDNA
ncbi:MAG: hypothetical protein FRX49_00181 [Trebouxia sp. A1-2]|nr:MAG: hypothetical protein FRX49_00181 [Trebouxia sp. A1-2]